MNDDKQLNSGTDAVVTAGRIGKEAKIGMAVIGVLLIGFCAALTWRLRGSTEASTTDDAAKSTALAAQNGGGDKQSENAKKPHSVAKPAEPTVVAASAAQDKPPKDEADWNIVGDMPSIETPTADNGASGPPLSYMPAPPAAEPVEVRDPYAKQVPPSAEPAPPAWQELPPSESDPAASGGPYQPVNESGPSSPSSNPAPQAEPNELRLIAPPPSRSLPEPAAVDMSQQALSPPQETSGGQFLPPPTEPVARDVIATPTAHGNSNAHVAPIGQTPADESGQYTVQPNDSYWTISAKLYGTGAFFKALAEHNRQRHVGPNQLAVGDVLKTPPREELEEIYPGLCPKPEHCEVQKNHLSTVSSGRAYGGGRTYVVQENDTLFDIARWELGKASRWFEIYHLNRDLIGSDYNYLPRGAELVLPESEPVDRVTQQPGLSSPLR